MLVSSNFNGLQWNFMMKQNKRAEKEIILIARSLLLRYNQIMYGIQ